jgi:hypothetical protein
MDDDLLQIEAPAPHGIGGDGTTHDGPMALAATKTTFTMAEIAPKCFFGVISATRTIVRAYMPEPPMPWKARKTILKFVLAMIT